MITTLKDFILTVEQLSDVSQAYELFEDETSEEVRELIYGLVSADEVEPFRAAMRLIGYADF
jgi:hypothetical protein